MKSRLARRHDISPFVLLASVLTDDILLAELSRKRQQERQERRRTTLKLLDSSDTWTRLKALKAPEFPFEPVEVPLHECLGEPTPLGLPGELEWEGCRWIFGEGEEARYCGHACTAMPNGRPGRYCAHHKKRAYAPMAASKAA